MYFQNVFFITKVLDFYILKAFSINMYMTILKPVNHIEMFILLVQK